MSFVLTSLPPLPHTFSSQRAKKLPEFRPLFFVPPLEDSPQNPIVDALIDASSPPDLVDQHLDTVGFKDPPELDNDEEAEQDLWVGESVKTQRTKCKNLTWDALRTSFPRQATSPFLSEQTSDAFDAVRHHVRPRLHDPSLQLQYMLPTDLFDLLMMNIIGDSSPLYIWDGEHECFVSNGARENARRLVIIEGLDDVASESFIQRFLRIGTLMRRLDMLVIEAQRQNSNSTVHALFHAVSTVLVHIRSALTRKPRHLATRLTSLWLYYADSESLLFALAALCGRKEHEIPRYEPISESPVALLSHVYKHLQRHIENGSPRPISAMVAYILTTASHDYFAGIGESLGIYELSRPPWLRMTMHSKSSRKHGNDVLQLEEEVLDQSSVSSVTDDSDENDFPDFFPLELVEALPAARKSLRILQAADPDHPLCSTSSAATCEWIWSSAEVETLWTDRATCGGRGIILDEFPNQPSATAAASPTNYKPELEQFTLFDLEPGAHLAKSICLDSSSSSRSSFETFLSAFPERLPPLTPTLQHLATVVLQPLLTHTVLLSGSLLHLYLRSLQLETHLTLLRSYMLLTFPPFKTRLVEALFSDSDEHGRGGRGTRVLTRARSGILGTRHATDFVDGPGAGQGIGLGHDLTERGTWPPGGADLSFFLRTVIVDSLEQRMADENDNSEAEKIWKEAEVRMGFALRDLPVGDGEARWLNPMSIEALDFLYLDYKPPHPLDIVITPEILSKYQRIFTFLLRLLRAEMVARIAFRSSFKSGGPVFEYTPSAQRTLVRLRFQIQAFITSLMGYVFDSAIGGNFDAYMRRISKLREHVLGDTLAAGGHEITDVFMLGESHSDLLNRILTGCLLRTAQRSAADALRKLLELILQLGVLLRDVRGEHLREAHAAEQLRELDELFQKQMLSFVKYVQILHGKSQGSRDNIDMWQHFGRLSGETGHSTDTWSPFEHLLMRIDPTGWWRRKLEGKGR